MSCTLRKSAVAKGKSRGSSARPNSYSATVASAPSFTAASLIMPSLMAGTLKSYYCIILALLKNEENPGSFGSSLETLLTANNLPKVKLGAFVPPALCALNGEVSASLLGDAINIAPAHAERVGSLRSKVGVVSSENNASAAITNVHWSC